MGTVVLVAASLGLGGCHEVTDQEIIEGSVLPLRGEQVVLTPEQVKCGEKARLWIVEQIEGAGAVARLEPAGRELFGDDVRMGDRRYSGPVAQVLGDGKLKIKKISNVTLDGTSEKVVTASAGVEVKHSCFPAPLPLLGIDRGDFSQDAEVRIHMRNDGGWRADQVLH
jgi:hypothetical protein